MVWDGFKKYVIVVLQPFQRYLAFWRLVDWIEKTPPRAYNLLVKETQFIEGWYDEPGRG